MLAVLRQRNFFVLWVGQVISLIGDWMLFMTLPFYIYALTGSTLATGIMFIVQTIPRFCLGSLAGVFVDRWNRKYTMLVTDLLQCSLLLPLLLVHSAGLIWIVYCFALIENTVSQFFIPAKTAIIPQIVDETHLLAANSLNASSQELTRLVGPLLGGLLFALAGIKIVIIADAASFLLSALMISLIVLTVDATRSRPSIPEQTISAQASLRKVGREWLEGLKLIRQENLVAAIFAVIAVAMIGEGIIEVIMVSYVSKVLHGSALILGWLMSAQAIGGIIGSLLIVRLSKLFSPARLIPICGLVFSGMLFTMAFLPFFVVTLALIMVAGMAVIGFFVSQITLLQSGVNNEYQGRVFGAFNTIQAVAMLVGMALASGLSDRFGPVTMLVVDASCNLLSALLAFWLIRPLLRHTPPINYQPETSAVTAAANATQERVTI